MGEGTQWWRKQNFIPVEAYGFVDDDVVSEADNLAIKNMGSNVHFQFMRSAGGHFEDIMDSENLVKLALQISLKITSKDVIWLTIIDDNGLAGFNLYNFNLNMF